MLTTVKPSLGTEIRAIGLTFAAVKYDWFREVPSGYWAPAPNWHSVDTVAYKESSSPVPIRARLSSEDGSARRGRRRLSPRGLLYDREAQ